MRNQKKLIQKITVHIPADILKNAQNATHKNITDTVKQALEEIAIRRACDGFRSLRGKVKFSLSLKELRGDY